MGGLSTGWNRSVTRNTGSKAGSPTSRVKHGNIDEYIASFSPDVRKILEEIRLTIRMMTAIGTPPTVDVATARKVVEEIEIGVCAIASSAPAAKMKVTSVMMNGGTPKRVIQKAW